MRFASPTSAHRGRVTGTGAQDGNTFSAWELTVKKMATRIRKAMAGLGVWKVDKDKDHCCHTEVIAGNRH